jgi:transcriptional regulator GlxA family with amidase domain
MLNATPSTAAVTSISQATAYSADVTVLSKLLMDASANLDNDRGISKACIQRAVDLLRSHFIAQCPPAGSPAVIRGGLAPWQAKRVAAYIEEHIGSNIRVPELARMVGLSTGHFFRTFRESFGETPQRYLARKRVQRGQQLMLSTRESLCQIALDCGMADQPHFTRVFRRVVGMNPGRWRRQFAAEADSAR